MEIQDCTTKELIDEIVARNECNRIGYYLDIDDCGFNDDELTEELEGRGYNVSQDEFSDIEEEDDDELKEELESRGFFVSESKPEDEIDIVRRDFERNPTTALNVLQDLLGMQHTATKEQVIEQLKNIL